MTYRLFIESTRKDHSKRSTPVRRGILPAPTASAAQAGHRTRFSSRRLLFIFRRATCSSLLARVEDGACWTRADCVAQYVKAWKTTLNSHARLPLFFHRHRKNGAAMRCKSALKQTSASRLPTYGIVVSLCQIAHHGSSTAPTLNPGLVVVNVNNVKNVKNARF